MKRTKEDAQATRQALLRAALTVFSRQGYADTRLDDVAAEAGVTRGAIYHHFGGKAELYTALVADATARVAPVMQHALATEGSPLEVLRHLFVDTLAYAEQDDDYRAINELVLFKTALPPELEYGIQQKREGTRKLIDVVAKLIAHGIAAGEIRADVSPYDAAVAFIAAQNGLMTLWLFDPDQFALEHKAKTSADLLVRGLLARP